MHKIKMSTEIFFFSFKQKYPNGLLQNRKGDDDIIDGH